LLKNLSNKPLGLQSAKANEKCLKELKKGESLRRAAALSGVSLGTAQKVIRLATAEGML